MRNGDELADFDSISAVPCPCGLAKRAFGDLADFPPTVHVIEIAETARLHYHRTLTKVYDACGCTADARMQLDQELIPVRVGSCILIRPKSRHRAWGSMKVLILVLPKFDPTDERFD